MQGDREQRIAARVMDSAVAKSRSGKDLFSHLLEACTAWWHLTNDGRAMKMLFDKRDWIRKPKFESFNWL